MHDYAVWLLKAGVHPKVVQERLGHETIGITMDIYSHVIAVGRQGSRDPSPGNALLEVGTANYNTSGATAR